LVLVILVLSNLLKKYYLTATRLRISEFEISENANYIDMNFFNKKLKQLDCLDNFFNCSSSEISLFIKKSDPWIKSVNVTKYWPNKLFIEIQEHQIYGILNDNYVITNTGKKLNIPDNLDTSGLVHIYTGEKILNEAIVFLDNIRQTLEDKAINLNSIHLSELRSVKMVLESGLSVNLGSINKLTRLNIFLNLIEQLDQNSIKYIDLRYDNGFAIKWKNQQEGLDDKI